MLLTTRRLECASHLPRAERLVVKLVLWILQTLKCLLQHLSDQPNLNPTNLDENLTCHQFQTYELPKAFKTLYQGTHLETIMLMMWNLVKNLHQVLKSNKLLLRNRVDEVDK